MSFQVVFSERAKRNLEDIVDYLESKWSARVSNNFLATVKKKSNQISVNPEMYEVSKVKKEARRCVVTRHTTMYYQVNKDRKKIEIVMFRDSRRNPDTLKF